MAQTPLSPTELARYRALNERIRTERHAVAVNAKLTDHIAAHNIRNVATLSLTLIPFEFAWSLFLLAEWGSTFILSIMLPVIGIVIALYHTIRKTFSRRPRVLRQEPWDEIFLNFFTTSFVINLLVPFVLTGIIGGPLHHTLK